MENTRPDNLIWGVYILYYENAADMIFDKNIDHAFSSIEGRSNDNAERVQLLISHFIEQM